MHSNQIFAGLTWPDLPGQAGSPYAEIEAQAILAMVEAGFAKGLMDSGYAAARGKFQEWAIAANMPKDLAAGILRRIHERVGPSVLEYAMKPRVRVLDERTPAKRAPDGGGEPVR